MLFSVYSCFFSVYSCFFQCNHAFSVYSCFFQCIHAGSFVTVVLYSIIGLLQFFPRLLKRFLKACWVRLEYPCELSVDLKLFSKNLPNLLFHFVSHLASLLRNDLQGCRGFYQPIIGMDGTDVLPFVLFLHRGKAKPEVSDDVVVGPGLLNLNLSR